MTPARRKLYLLSFAALLIRLAIWPWFDGIEPQIYDERDYVAIATSLAERGEFAMHGNITSARPPLYPAMVGLVYRLAGVGQHQAVRLLQILLNVALVPVVFALGRRLYDERTGLWAAGIAVFYPSLWGHDYLVLTEVLFTLLLTAGALALVELVTTRAEAEPRPTWSPACWAILVAAGVCFGLAALARSSLLFYPLFLAPALFGWWRAPSRRRIAAVTVFFTVFLLTLAPWIARNSRLEGRLASIDSYSGQTAVRFSPLRPLLGERTEVFPTRSLSNARDRSSAPRSGSPPRAAAPTPAGAASPGAAIVPDETPAPWRQAFEASGRLREARPGPEGRAIPRSAASTAGGPASSEGPAVAERLARSLAGVFWDATLFWRIDREVAAAAARGWLGPLPRKAVLALTMIVAAYYVAMMLLGVAGLALRPPADRAQLAIVLSSVAALWSVHALTIGHSRYHIPLMPLVALFAARLLVARGAPVTRRRLVAAAVAVTLLVGGWTAALVRDDLSDLRNSLGRRETSGAAR